MTEKDSHQGAGLQRDNAGVWFPPPLIDDGADTVSVAQIRMHMQEILADFKRGDFSKPFHVHNMKVPGTDVMRANASKISYTVVESPTGADLLMATRDSATLAAIRTFLKFQREDHHAGDHDM